MPFNPDTYGRLIPMLEDWAKWMKNYNCVRGFPRQSLMMHSMASKDIEDMENESDHAVSVKIDSAIDDLPPAQKAAINYRYGMVRVFCFPRNNYDELIETAHDRLFIAVKKKGVEILK